MTDDGSTTAPPAAPEGAGGQPPDHRADEVPTLKTGPAALILGLDARTVERWIDDGKLIGGRPRDPRTGRPVKGSHRWASARHVVELAVGNNRADLVPPELRYLIPDLGPQGDPGGGLAGS